MCEGQTCQAKSVHSNAGDKLSHVNVHMRYRSEPLRELWIRFHVAVLCEYQYVNMCRRGSRRMTVNSWTFTIFKNV